MNNQVSFQIRAVKEQDRIWVVETINNYWGEEFVVINEEVYYPEQLPGFIAITSDTIAVGLVTYLIRGKVCEIITLNSVVANCGVGSNLIEAVRKQAETSGCAQLCLATTNDNQEAIEFYQSRGFRLGEIRKGAVDRGRKIKPSIPEVSPQGIPICDEWEFVLDLSKP